MCWLNRKADRVVQNGSKPRPHVLWITLWIAQDHEKTNRNSVVIERTAYFLGIRTVRVEPQLIVVSVYFVSIFTHF